MNRILISLGLLAASSLLAVAGLFILIEAGHITSARPPRSPARSTLSAAQPTTSPTPGNARPAGDGAPSMMFTLAPSTTATPPAVVAAGDGPAGDHALQQVLDASSHPNLPPRQAQQLVALGDQVWLAQITGIGRGQWPTYFHGVRSGFVYHAVRIQAAIARASGSGQVTVHLVWAGTDPAGQPLTDQPATIRLQHSGTNWQPVH
ncbi:hypothetical protein [Streptantibioticus ferralitis]|uniref:Uncharacterized protein n=1 Tax=Streptantibioticus ferralitis TaxID=236510 RepID=A0ABT5Z774_9ACTN|nr:hypothetical protein [Streptantibioticus ferralitis]MDF2259679.1 hypothetical protein [Streptantibioticus ferralitis]